MSSVKELLRVMYKLPEHALFWDPRSLGRQQGAGMSKQGGRARPMGGGGGGWVRGGEGEEEAEQHHTSCTGSGRPLCKSICVG